MTSHIASDAPRPGIFGPLIALGIGAFGIGLTEFVIMGLLPQVAADLGVSVPQAGLLVSGYAFGVTLGGPFLTLATARLRHRHILILLMILFTAGNILCALSPSYALVLAARVLTGFAHGTFFGIGSVVAQSLVRPERKASAIALLFTGLTLATVLGLPFGTWLGQGFGWRATFWSVAAIGAVAALAMALALPEGRGGPAPSWRVLAGFAAPAPLRALAMTVFGYAGVFMVFTYIAPILTDFAAVPEAHVSLYLLLFGAGLVAGNIMGGRLADRHLVRAVHIVLLALAVGLALARVAMPVPVLTGPAVFFFGALSFSTVAPLQAFMMRRAPEAGEALGATLNISAFNLGNAIGAWLGGLVLSAGLGLAMLFPLAAILPLIALLLALTSGKDFK